MSKQDGVEDPDAGMDYLDRIRTAQSVNISSELFEKLYLNPESRVPGDLRKRFANPTPLPLLGFLIATGALCPSLMGWRGAGGGGAANIGAYYFFGGLLQIFGAIFEWIIGNTFIYVVFGSYGAFWLAFAATLTPAFNAEEAYLGAATTAAERAAGLASFEATLAFFLAFMGVLTFMYMVCAIRTNAVFFTIFVLLEIAFWLLTAGYWKAASGDAAAFATLAKATGACLFALDVLGFYLLFAQLLQAVDFPLDLPVGDLAHLVPSKTKLAKRKES
ncbi:hypothetical protein LTR56_022998 [Elasticomyces elasticus]|nr:hypothetical protein LTR56_022998 [Elasticomyces elasticus]KAK3668104.1 hypothetical protein LTR22_001175 [Elasticomyces elasticus]KAK4925252.1 hypothetical protein LTR49_007793 [Elasticomyces elasticus]KAK5752853.1 hypothetical protein LTS12_017024 [Elasticomyces elasticus]